ncbi:hypothetical protein [Albirhodobacter sp. R86504]|uniref:phage head spike fiber domain-containing protein n=1 Tax=Albirhodobacter sp. R86504 TaxID=3093848 RepID=UPI00366A639B
MLGLSRAFTPIALQRTSYRNPVETYTFISGQLPSGLTFARASVGSYTQVDGALVLAPTATPRFDYAPIGGLPRGLLLEAAATNLVDRSTGYSTTSWRRNGVSVGGPNATSPMAGVLSEMIVEDSSNGRHDIEYNFGSGQAGEAYSASIYVKQGTRSRVRFRCGRSDSAESITVNLISGAVEAVGTRVTSHRCEDVGNGWWRLALTTTLDQTSTAQYLQVRLLDASGGDSYPGNGSGSINVWGAQREKGNSTSSHIVTDGARATRQQDVLTLPPRSGLYDLMLYFDAGITEVRKSVLLSQGWTFTALSARLSRIEIFPQGSL